MKAIDLCIARFDDDTKEAFLDLYTKVDAGVSFDTPEDDGTVNEDGDSYV